MRNEDIKARKDYKIDNIEDFVHYNAYWYGIDHCWMVNEDGGEQLVIWLDFSVMPTFVRAIGHDFVIENEELFQCKLDAESISIRNFDEILRLKGFDKEKIEELFRH